LRHATREDFLRFCGMRLGVRAMRDDDIPRVCELMTRTHQLNTTGRMFDPAAVLNQSRTASAARRVVVAELQDLFGGYGIIGTAVTETRPPVWRLVYLAISCRVMGRGVERALLAKLAEEGLRLGATILETEFRDTGQNPMMRALYQMAGFRDTGTTLEDGTAIFRAPSPVAPEIPGWVEVT
jgi:FkbH-like protein